MLDATFMLSALSVSHVQWYISAGQAIPGRSAADDWEMCSPVSMYRKAVVLHLHTGTDRAWDIRWQIDDGRENYGPIRMPVFIGADASLSEDTFLEGSIAEVSLLRYPVSSEGADCMFSYGEMQVGVCVPLNWERGWLATAAHRSQCRSGSRRQTAQPSLAPRRSICFLTHKILMA